MTQSSRTRSDASWFSLYIALLFTAVLTVWFSQKSINAYWQQTYHRASPLEELNRYEWWRSGEYAQDAANGWYQNLADRFAAQNEVWNAVRPEPKTDTAGVQAALPNVSASEPQPAGASAPQSAQSEAADMVELKAGDKVFFAGDSMMQGVAPFVQKHLKSAYGIDSINLSKQSTGLSYPKFFDWPATVEQTFATNRDIKLLVVFLGPNDPWDFADPEHPGPYARFKSERWAEIYSSRIDRVLKAAEANGAKVIWVGVPYMKAAKLNEQMRYLAGVQEAAVKGRAIWLPTERLLSNGSAAYADSINIEGKTVRVRSKDGIHFTPSGQKRLADYVAAHIRYTAPAGTPPQAASQAAAVSVQP